MWERVRDWLAERRQKLDLFDETLVARQDNPLYLMGPMLYYFWLITVVTGVILMLWYEPTTTGAYTSIERIQNDIGRLALTFLGRPVTLGGLTRGLHKYGADALITITFLRIYRMYFLAEYKKPGELSWMLAFLGLILGMVSGITGYLLIWNQRAFWAAKVVLTVPVYFDELPLIGPLKFGSMIAFLFLGGPAVGQATITRFYALHFGISLVLLLLVEVFFQRTRRKRINMSLFPLAVLYFLAFTALILFNIAVIERDPFLIMNITLVVLALGLFWELRHRRQQRQAAAAGISPPARAPVHG